MAYNGKENVLIQVFSDWQKEDERLIYEGPASFDYRENVFLLRYTDGEGVDNRVRFSKNSCLISRRSDQDIRVHLSRQGASYIEVVSEMGRLRLDAVPADIFFDEQHARLKYVIPSADPDELLSFVWKIAGHLS